MILSGYRSWRDGAILEARGGVPMRFNDKLRDCTAFLYTTGWNKNKQVFEGLPKGTAFFLSVYLDPDAKPKSELTSVAIYAVTARHNITDCDRRKAIYVVANKLGGGVKPIKTYRSDWTCHKTTDVAVCEVTHELADDISADWVSSEQLLSQNRETSTGRIVGLGDEVLTIGLFFRLPGKDSIQPVARFGHISLLPNESEKITIKLDKDKDDTTPVEAYLVELTSWEGQSGSPVFVSFGHVYEFVRVLESSNDSLKSQTILRPQPLCLGLVHGSWIDELPSGDGGVRHRMNMGLTPVIPAHKIIELLMEDEELVAERKRKLGKQAGKQAPPKPLSLEHQQPLTKEKFEDVLKKASQKTSQPESKSDET